MASGSGPFPDPADSSPAPRHISTLARAIRFLKPYRMRAVGAVLALVTTAAATLGIGQAMRHLIDGGFVADDPGALNQALIMLIVLAIIMAGGTFLRHTLVSWLGERLVADLRNAVFQQIMRLHIGFFEVNKTGEILSRLTTDTTLLQAAIGSAAALAVRQSLTLVGGTVMMAVTNLKLALIAFLVVPVVVVPILFIGRRVRRLSRESQDKVAAVGAFAEETFNAMRTVQSFTHEAEDRRRFAEEVDDAFHAATRSIRLRGLLSAMVILLVFAAVALVLWVGGGDVAAGRITVGDLAAFIFYAVVVAFSLGMITEVYGELQRAAGAADRLVDLLHTSSQITAPHKPVPLPQPPRGEVAFEGVRFHYPSRPDRAALNDFSLTVARGETVALVGPSGAGKSTVFQLLLRFYDPASGTVRLDGVDLRTADPGALRRTLAVVPQDPVIFSTTGLENIRYGNPEADDEAVYAAARAAAADSFLEALPDGYDTFLGEKGVRLSGGQRQRVAIARAILRDPAVLLLDEATSALDAESERLVQQAMSRLMSDRTTLIIAHRLATVVNADRIAVIDEGRIVATGRHAELLETSPLYARLAALQFNRPGISDTPTLDPVVR